jgi:LCP family protein required for cell wall assembly
VLSTQSPWRGFAARYFTALIAGLLVMAVAFVVVDTTRTDILNQSPTIGGLRTKYAAPNAPENIVIVGSDSRAFVSNTGQANAFGQRDTSARSDTLMVLHVDAKAQTAYLVSFPRDMWVNIPGIGMSKINAAYNAGPQKVIDTLQADFGLTINHYLEVDFSSFQNVVDAVGGIKIFFPAPARDKFSGLNVPSYGCINLNGQGALAYVRSRHYEQLGANGKYQTDAVPDIARIGRQQAFLRKLVSTVIKSTSNDPLKLTTVAGDAMKYVHRDPALSNDDMLGLVAAFADVNVNDASSVQMVTLPWKTGPNQGGQDVLYADAERDAPVLAQLRATEQGSKKKSTTSSTAAKAVAPADVMLQVLNGSGVAGAAHTALTALVGDGFQGTVTGYSGSVVSTEVHYKAGALSKAQAVQLYLGGVGKLVSDSTLTGVDVSVVLGPDFKGVSAPQSTTTVGSSGSGTTTTAPLGVATAAATAAC